MALLCINAATVEVCLSYNCGKSGIPVSVNLFCGINILTWCCCNIVGAKLKFSHTGISTSWILPNMSAGGSCLPLVCSELFEASYVLTNHATPPSMHIVSESCVALVDYGTIELRRKMLL